MYYIIAIYIVKFIHYETKSFKRRSSGLKVIKEQRGHKHTHRHLLNHTYFSYRLALHFDILYFSHFNFVFHVDFKFFIICLVY